MEDVNNNVEKWGKDNRTSEGKETDQTLQETKK